MLTPGFVLRRLLQVVPTLGFILLVTFLLVHLLPGDPLTAMAGDRVTDADVARSRHDLGLDQPLPVQFLSFARRVVVGDLGRSFVIQVPVTQLIAERLPVTLLLTGMAAALAVGLAVPLAVVAAMTATGRSTSRSGACSRSGSPCRSSMSGSCC